MKIEIDGVTYVPQPPAEPKWGCGGVADVWLDKLVVQLSRSADTWTCGSLDIIHREASCKTAVTALKWYRDECARLKDLTKTP
jgi:hypothetical protein